MLDAKRALVLAPHTDDGELGCGASIARLVREGVEVWYVAFSKCEESLPEGSPKDTLVHELKKATNVLGILDSRVRVLDYKVRHFSDRRQDVLDDLICIGREVEPDLVFLPSQDDIHQDHSTISSEGLRAFKKQTILAYELPWNNYSFKNQAFICVSADDASKKAHAIAQYESQSERQYVTRESVMSILKYHGLQIGKPYAEVFELPRLVVS